MSHIQLKLESIAISRGYQNAQQMRDEMGETAYSQLCAKMIPVAPAASDDSRTIRVYSVMEPTTQVFVKTSEQKVHAKLKGIRRDISEQKFSRWAPFAGLPQSIGDGKGGKLKVPSWAWEFVDAA